MDKLVSEVELPVQKDLDVHHLLPEQRLTLQQVARDLRLVLELDPRLQALGVLTDKQGNLSGKGFSFHPEGLR